MSSHGKALLRAKKQSAKAVRSRYQTCIDAQKDLLQNAPKATEAPKLKSIWETSNMEEFLSIADQREAGYLAERNVRVVVGGNVHVITKDQRVVPKAEDERDWFSLSDKLMIPHRPEWDYKTSADELQAKEEADFIEWRRYLAQAEESNRVTMTPYEKNLDVWRQLWRVTEKSDIVLEILDARNPQAFRSMDLERLITKMKNANDSNKRVILLLNKADLLTENQRKTWAEFFKKRKDTFFFFSAKPKEKDNGNLDPVGKISRKKDNELMDHGDSLMEDDSEFEDSADEDNDAMVKGVTKCKSGRNPRNKRKLNGAPVQCANPYEAEAMQRDYIAYLNAPKAPKPIKEMSSEEKARNERLQQQGKKMGVSSSTFKPWDVLDPESLLDELVLFRPSLGINDSNESMMVGMVGYPNVGKSSTINAIMGCKKVVVSATPGKTKHFQTLVIPNERRLQLCDCPGLVFPSFAASRESMICDGILPIDSVKDYVTPIAVVCERIPRIILEMIYGVSLAKETDVDECTSLADLFLCAVARKKGYMTEHDKPNRSRAAKEILKMYVDGGLVYVHPSRGHVPDMPPELAEYHQVSAYQPRGAGAVATHCRAPVAQLSSTPNPISSSAQHELDDEYEDLSTSEDEDGGIWEDISSADEARALSQPDIDDYQDTDDHTAHFAKLPLFFSRSSGGISRQELFNYENNAAIALPLIEAEREKVRRKKKKINKQAQQDLLDVVEITEDGHKQLIIDSDDDIKCYTQDDGGMGKRRDKVKSKRTQRREAKRVGMSMPQNPTKRIIGISVDN